MHKGELANINPPRITTEPRNLWNVDVNGNALEEWKAFPQEKK